MIMYSVVFYYHYTIVKQVLGKENLYLPRYVLRLLQKPDLVASTWLNLASATWFFTYPQPPKPRYSLWLLLYEYSVPSNRVISSLEGKFGTVGEPLVLVLEGLFMKISNLCKNYL